MTPEIPLPEIDIRRWRDSVKGIMDAASLLIKAKANMPNETFTNFVRLQTGLDISAAGKVMRVGNHPILSDPKNADKIPANWAFLYESSFLPDNILLAAIDSGDLMTMTKYDIWHIRGGAEDSARVRRGNNGVKGGAGNQRENAIKIPAGENIESVVRRGMKLEQEGSIPIDAARMIGIGVASYRMARMAIVLIESEFVSEAERAIATQVLKEMNRTNNVRRYYATIEPIVNRVFGAETNQKYDDERVLRRIEKFRGAIVIIQDTCLGGAELEIPPLPAQIRAEVVERLTKAREAIGQLKGKVLKVHD